MHKHLDACGPGVGKQVAVMGMSTSKRMDRMGQQPLGARAHVYRRRIQPQGVDTDHRKTSRSHAAQTTAALTGHVTLTPSAPRLNSSVIISDMALGRIAGGAGAGGTSRGTVNSMKRVVPRPPPSPRRLTPSGPYAYLKDVLERLPTQPASAMTELLPYRWSPAT